MLTHLQKARADMATMNRLLPEAERIARHLGDEYPAAEHLVAAGFSLDDGIAAAVLAAHGIDRDGWLEALRQQHQDAFQLAVSLAHQDRSPLTSAHVLLAAIEADHGTVPRTLARLRIDRTALAAELRAGL